MTVMTYTTQKQVRAAFWDEHPELELQARRHRTLTAGQNAQATDTRCAFVDFVDDLERCGQISEALAQRVTL